MKHLGFLTKEADLLDIYTKITAMWEQWRQGKLYHYVKT